MGDRRVERRLEEEDVEEPQCQRYVIVESQLSSFSSSFDQALVWEGLLGQRGGSWVVQFAQKGGSQKIKPC